MYATDRNEGGRSWNDTNTEYNGDMALEESYRHRKAMDGRFSSLRLEVIRRSDQIVLSPEDLPTLLIPATCNHNLRVP